MTASGDPILDRLAADALKRGMGLARKEELRTPVLVLQDERGRTERLLLATPDVPPSETMKIMLWAHKATHAAVCVEGWVVAAAPPPEGTELDAWKRRALGGQRPEGMPRPSEHPDRFDALILIAQARDIPAGPRIHRQWRIADGTPRAFAEDDLTNAIDMPSNFWPMFVGEQQIHRIAARYRQLIVILRRERSR